MRRLVDSAEEVVEVVRDGTELALEPENKAAMERIDEETIQLQEAALALHKAKQRMEIGAVEYASRVKEYSERMKELEAERNELLDYFFSTIDEPSHCGEVARYLHRANDAK